MCTVSNTRNTSLIHPYYASSLVFGYMLNVRSRVRSRVRVLSRVRCSLTFQVWCSCSFVFDNLWTFRVRVRSCSIFFEKSVFVFVHVRANTNEHQCPLYTYSFIPGLRNAHEGRLFKAIGENKLSLTTSSYRTHYRAKLKQKGIWCWFSKGWIWLQFRKMRVCTFWWIFHR